MARVLVIDDDKGLLDLMTLILRRDNYEMIAAAGGAEGIDLFDAQKPDIVIVDAAMPNVDGFAVTEYIRGVDEETGQHTPVIMLTAYGQESSRQRGEEAGVDRYVVKPIKPKDILAHINELLEQPA